MRAPFSISVTQTRRTPREASKYRAHPDPFDNKGYLKNGPTPEIHQRFIDTRIRHMRVDIDNFQNQISELLKAGGQ